MKHSWETWKNWNDFPFLLQWLKGYFVNVIKGHRLSLDIICRKQCLGFWCLVSLAKWRLFLALEWLKGVCNTHTELADMAQRRHQSRSSAAAVAKRPTGHSGTSWGLLGQVAIHKNTNTSTFLSMSKQCQGTDSKELGFPWKNRKPGNTLSTLRYIRQVQIFPSHSVILGHIHFSNIKWQDCPLK